MSHLLSRLPPNKLRYHDASEPRHAQGEFCRSCVCSALQVVTGLKHVAQNAFPDCREPLNQILTCVRTSWNLANERFFGSGLQMRNDVLMFTGGTCSHHQPIDLRQIQTCHEKSEKSVPETKWKSAIFQRIPLANYDIIMMEQPMESKGTMRPLLGSHRGPSGPLQLHHLSKVRLWAWENIPETHGKPMGNPWETHGNPWKPMLFSHLSGFPAPFPLNQFWREDLTICSWCSLSWHVITSAHQKGRNQIQRWSFWDAMSTQKILWFIIVPIKVGTNY